MPPRFKALYPRTRVVIDGTEIKTERPSKQKQRIHLWSNYKHAYTLKFLVGIAPSGEFTFLSKAFGGRATDTEITVRSGLVQLLEKNDRVMADKGFPQIEEDVNNRGAFLITPPLKSKAAGLIQFTAEESDRAYEVASVRIEVERAIERLKRFEILKFLHRDMVPLVDDIMTTLCLIANLQGDLTKRK